MNSWLLQQYSSIRHLITVHLARSDNGFLYRGLSSQTRCSRRMKTTGKCWQDTIAEREFPKRKLRSIVAASSLSASSGREAHRAEPLVLQPIASQRSGQTSRSGRCYSIAGNTFKVDGARRQGPPFCFLSPFHIDRSHRSGRATFTNQQLHETVIMAACSQNIMSH